MSESDLRQAFEILLRRPLADFDPAARYAFYYWDDIVSTEFFDEDLDLGLLARGEIVQPPYDGAPGLHVPAPWPVDLGRSVFTVDMDVKGFHRPRRGTRVAKILAAEGLTGADMADEWVSIDLCVHTDGTLFDAMRTATGTDHLVPFETDIPNFAVQPKWERRLAAISDPALRDHMRMLCLDAHSARGSGAHFVGTRYSGFHWMPEKGYQVLAAWELGEGQGSMAVAQLP
ncbi:hypothetical protein [Actinoplanes sp. G11-F43]|uniref:hypothetical protein n=1 Tax=Actinoplanes sp. G11-F43 TaxID=3424130 RepID=UPI003D32F0B7